MKMKKYLFVALLTLVSARARSEEIVQSASHSHIRIGGVYFGNHLPSPEFTGSLSLGNGFFLEGNIGTLIVVGFADGGVRYELPVSGLAKPYFGGRSGLNYSVTDSALYYAATLGVKLGKYYLEADPLWYYRRDFENSHDNKIERNFLISIQREVP